VQSAHRQRRWSLAGDLNGFFGLVVDNLAVMAFLATVLVGLFKFPAEIVFTRMFPGTALGVLVGDLIYTWMAVRLSRATGRYDVTAMPLGIDTPTTIGLALLVLGPAFARFKQSGLDEHAAAIATWHLGMASMMVMGLLKFVLSFAGAWVGRVVPRAGLLGSIAAIALMLIGFLPIVEVMQVPIVGFVTLGVILYTVVAKGVLPGRVPGVLAAVLIGLSLYYTLGPLGLAGPGYRVPGVLTLRFALPVPSLGFIDGMAATVPYLPLILPFGLLMVIGGINVTESARVAGDDYKTRDILLTEAFATLVAGLCGGRRPDDPLYRPAGLQKNGSTLGLYAPDRRLRRARGHLWLPFQPGRTRAARRARPDPCLCLHRHHRPGIRRVATAPFRGGGVQLFPGHRPPACHRARQPGLRRAGAVHATAYLNGPGYA